MSITEVKERIGHYTSSQMYRLMGTPAVQKTYMEEVLFETQLKVSCKEEASGKPMNWGTMMQHYVAENYMPVGYEWHDKTEVHPKYKLWSGTPDIVSEDGTGDVKCFYRKKFAQVANCIATREGVEPHQLLRKNHPDIYWQITSNSAILKKSKCMLVLFLPNGSELDAVRDFAANSLLPEEWKYRFIVESAKSELPYQSDDSIFPNVIYYEWELVQSDVELIENKFKLLNNGK